MILSLYFGEDKPLKIMWHRNRSQDLTGNQCYSSPVDQTHPCAQGVLVTGTAKDETHTFDLSGGKTEQLSVVREKQSV